jgi:hypothetical protein
MSGLGDVSAVTMCDDRTVRDAIAVAPRTVRVCFVTVRAPGVAWTVTTEDRAAALHRLDSAYAPVQLRFVEHHLIDVVSEASNVPTNGFQGHLNELFAAHERPDCLNIFTVNRLGPWAGFGSFSWMPHPSLAIERASLASSSLVHEVGHTMGDLFHPFEDSLGVEAAGDHLLQCTVDGATRPCSEVRGDLLSSTPADSLTACQNAPSPSCNADCLEDFMPDRTLVMSYGWSACRTRFTDEQLRKLLCTTVTYRAAMIESACGACAVTARTCTDDRTLRESSVGHCDEATAMCQFATSVDTACLYGCLDGACQGCRPSCNGRVCGGDGCGGACGACDADEACVDGACVYTCPADRGCTRAGRSCTSGGAGVLVCTASARNPSCFDSVLQPCRDGETCIDGSCVCAPGFFTCRGACVPRRQEVCNGVDDDCDGMVDEDRACVARYDLPALASLFPLEHTRGDREYNDHGPVGEVNVTWLRTPSTVTVRACVTMTETRADWTTGSRCIDVVTINVRNSAVLTPPFHLVYLDRDHGHDDAMARAHELTRSDLVRRVTCVGDGPGLDICSDRSFESGDCSGCQIQLGTIEIIRTP